MLPAEQSFAAALTVLGLAADADRDEVTRAYRRLARTTHPDVSGDPDAAARFDALSHAYQLALEAIGRRDTPSRLEAGQREAQRPATSAGQDGSYILGEVGVAASPWTPRPRAPRNAPIVAGPVVLRPLRTTRTTEGA